MASTPKNKVDLVEVARILGMKYATPDEQRKGKRNEIVDAEEAPGGTVVRTVDGQAYIIVPEDRPDAEGKTGVMWLTGPPRIVDGKLEPYLGSFPVFAQAGVSKTGDFEDVKVDG